MEGSLLFSSLLTAVLEFLRRLFVSEFIYTSMCFSLSYITITKIDKKKCWEVQQYYFKLKKNERLLYLMSCGFAARILKKTVLQLTPEIKFCELMCL